MFFAILLIAGIAVTYNGDEIGMVDYRNITWKGEKIRKTMNNRKPKKILQF